MLDAHISGPEVGRALEELGHDVKPMERMERVPDDALPETAVRDGRTLVTHNVRGFLQIVRDRPPEKSRPGLILVPHPVKLQESGTIIRGVRSTLAGLSQGDWVNGVEWLRK